MTESVRRELIIPKSPEKVWCAIADSDSLEKWMYPNDFEPQVGHQFTFRVPANPQANFDGLIVECEVIECEPPHRLVFSWSVGNLLVGSQVRFELEGIAEGTRVLFEHSGFDVTLPHGKQAYGGAKYGWTKMLDQLVVLVTESPA